ncbi:hypothetical protein B0H17DRAFT_1149161 [Mycena rosella]|uniref:Uncharacterized protein n=1 Tax=Mycena rosella TaxID=1033263 RepID=A0AAD7FS30_MYCRO|nr:hypothetical protein B0H17DRAFT_1149161 [Mycena rosella]
MHRPRRTTSERCPGLVDTPNRRRTTAEIQADEERIAAAADAKHLAAEEARSSVICLSSAQTGNNSLHGKADMQYEECSDSGSEDKQPPPSGIDTDSDGMMLGIDTLLCVSKPPPNFLMAAKDFLFWMTHSHASGNHINWHDIFGWVFVDRSCNRRAKPAELGGLKPNWKQAVAAAMDAPPAVGPVSVALIVPIPSWMYSLTTCMPSLRFPKKKETGPPARSRYAPPPYMERAFTMWTTGQFIKPQTARSGRKSAKSFLAVPWAARAAKYLVQIKGISTAKYEETVASNTALIGTCSGDNNAEESSESPDLCPEIFVSDDEPEEFEEQQALADTGEE